MTWRKQPTTPAAGHPKNSCRSGLPSGPEPVFWAALFAVDEVAAVRERSLIWDELGDFSLAGFYANGEISNDRLYGFTGVLTLFL